MPAHLPTSQATLPLPMTCPSPPEDCHLHSLVTHVVHTKSMGDYWPPEPWPVCEGCGRELRYVDQDAP